jgi:Uma2 family endonuclease
MSVRIPTSPKSEVTGPVVYPESDGEPMAETEVHILALIDLLSTLRFHYRSQPDFYVIGNMFLYYQEGNPNARKAPDLMVVKGIDTSFLRRTFKTWEEKAVPSVIVELTSKDTWQEDLGPKKTVYAQLGVAEYIMFDPLHEYLPHRLQGYRLVGKEYVAIENESEECLVSKELELRLCPEGTYLRMNDVKTGKRILAPEESYSLAKEALEQAEQEKRRADQEERRADQEKHRADQERQHAEQEKQRAEAAEAEVARLRAMLEKRQDGNP